MHRRPIDLDEESEDAATVLMGGADLAALMWDSDEGAVLVDESILEPPASAEQIEDPPSLDRNLPAQPQPIAPQALATSDVLNRFPRPGARPDLREEEASTTGAVPWALALSLAAAAGGAVWWFLV